MASQQQTLQSLGARAKRCFAIVAFGFTTGAQAQPLQNPPITLPKAHQTIHVDGLLNEPIWQQATVTEHLRDANGTYNTTTAYVAYDADNLYAGFTCQVNDWAKVSTEPLDKDNQFMLEHDWVAFCVDTYHDGINAYAFLVDATGNTLDGALNPPTGDLSFSFSTKWTSAVTRTANTYTVEMKIPLETLPIRWQKDRVTMGLQVIRHNTQNNRMGLWPFTKSISAYQPILLHGIHPTHPENLSGVNLKDRLAYKQSKIDVTTLLGRCQGGDASVMDYYIFKKRAITGATHPRRLYEHKQPDRVKHLFENTPYFKGLKTDVDFETLLERAQTTAFLVLQNDTILYENYGNGYTKDSVFTSFSVAKSFVSALVGIAIGDGLIKSEMDPITDYLPELLKKDARFSNITIRDLLSMSSGLAYSHEGFPSDDEFTYQSPDLQQAVLNKVRIAEPPETHWLYNNYNPLLLGMLLERTTGQSVSKYAEDKLWKKMGGSQASWSLDEQGFEKMESGINCGAYDYARFALLFLNNGRYNGTQVIPKDWIARATQPQDRPKGYYDSLVKNNLYYNYLWWGKFRNGQNNANDFFGMGNKGQYVYICPEKHLIIIRLGFEYGFNPGANAWPSMFYQFASEF